MFEIFSDLARQAIVQAQDEALGLGDDFVGTEHLLLGLAGVPGSVAGMLLSEHGLTVELARSRATEIHAITGAGPAPIAPADALAAIGIDVAAIRQRADEAFGPGSFVYPRPGYDDAAKAAIELSVAQARQLGHDYVGTGHMLLGMRPAARSCWPGRPERPSVATANCLATEGSEAGTLGILPEVRPWPPRQGSHSGSQDGCLV